MNNNVLYIYMRRRTNLIVAISEALKRVCSTRNGRIYYVNVILLFICTYNIYTYIYIYIYNIIRERSSMARAEIR